MRERVVARLKFGVALLLFATRMLAAQSVDEYQVKAAYLYNFAKFVEWPAQRFENANAPLYLCVWNDPSFQADLSRITSAKKIGEHPIVAISVDKPEQARGCHVFFVGAANVRRARDLLPGLRGASVLTVGESRDFLESGGIINFVLQDNRVQFDVNSKTAAETGLQISSRVLSLARTVLR